MKKSKILFWVLLGLIGLNSCTDAKDPVINEKALDGSLSFKLNQPLYSKYTLEDAISTLDMDSLTCVQPDYGFTAAVTYTTEVSFGASFAKGTYQVLPTTVNGEKVGVNVKEMDKAIIALYGGSLPNPVVEKQVYIRLKAVISSATQSQVSDSLIVKPVYSNAISLKITPYVLPLFPYTEVEPRLWYIVGLDGVWNNSVAGLGSSLIPMGVLEGKKYNLSGDGEFKYTGYFMASKSFKLIRDVGAWAEQWGNAGGEGINNLHRKMTGESDPSNIKVPADGYYELTINSVENKATMVPVSITPSVYNKIGLIGAFNGWSGDVDLTANASAGNHIWYTTYTFGDDSQCKLRANAEWAVNWGSGGSSDGNPAYSKMGVGVAGGKNFIQTKGTYTIILNDVDGCYYFIKK
ncbi:MAG: hypothetical protein RIS29_2453 [Bacteroidota bacterium]